MMESNTIKVNGVDVTCYADGSVEWMHGGYKKMYRTFGSKQSKGYRAVKVRGKMSKVHRLIAQAFLTDWNPDWSVDHINGTKHDNRPTNLRQFETNAEHCQAFQKKSENCSSRYRGVTWYKWSGKWMAQIIINRKRIHLGYFETEEAAAIAFDRKAEELGFSPEAFNRNNYPDIFSLPKHKKLAESLPHLY